MQSLRKSVCVLVLACLSSAAFARSSVPIVNYDDSPITAKPGRELTLDTVQHAVAAAGARSGHWSVADSTPGRVRLKLTTRGHEAVIEVTFTTQSYSIHYVSSSNLNYEKSGDRELIHPKYNAWVQHLKTALDQELL